MWCSLVSPFGTVLIPIVLSSSLVWPFFKLLSVSSTFDCPHFCVKSVLSFFGRFGFDLRHRASSRLSPVGTPLSPEEEISPFSSAPYRLLVLPLESPLCAVFPHPRRISLFLASRSFSLCSVLPASIGTLLSLFFDQKGDVFLDVFSDVMLIETWSSPHAVRLSPLLSC